MENIFTVSMLLSDKKTEYDGAKIIVRELGETDKVDQIINSLKSIIKELEPTCNLYQVINSLIPSNYPKKHVSYMRG